MQGTEKPDHGTVNGRSWGCAGLWCARQSDCIGSWPSIGTAGCLVDGLFCLICSGGQGPSPSVPGSVIAVVMVLQALEGCSDRRVQWSGVRCDVRWIRLRRVWASTMRVSTRAC